MILAHLQARFYTHDAQHRQENRWQSNFPRKNGESINAAEHHEIRAPTINQTFQKYLSERKPLERKKPKRKDLRDPSSVLIDFTQYSNNLQPHL